MHDDDGVLSMTTRGESRDTRFSEASKAKVAFIAVLYRSSLSEQIRVTVQYKVVPILIIVLFCTNNINFCISVVRADQYFKKKNPRPKSANHDGKRTTSSGTRNNISPSTYTHQFLCSAFIRFRIDALSFRMKVSSMRMRTRESQPLEAISPHEKAS